MEARPSPQSSLVNRRPLWRWGLIARRAMLASGATWPLALSACQLNPFDRPSSDQVLRLSTPAIGTLDPILIGGVSEAQLAVQVFGGLTGLNEKLEVVPDLAEKWQISPDGKVYTFTLRRGAKFQDGRELRAADVRYSLERAADPANRSTTVRTYLGDISGLLDRLEGRAREVAGIRIKDDLTVEITLNEPRVEFLAKLTYPVAFVVDRTNVETGGAQWWTRAIGTGPFRLRSYQRESETVILARHDAYYGAKPALSEVHFFPATPLDSYEAGQIDIAEVELSDVERVTDRSSPLNRELRVRNELDVHYLALNVTAKPFDDAKVRQAFNHALDREKIASVTLKKTVVVADGILPPGMPGRNDRAKGLPFDVSRARQLIAESTYRDARNFPDIVLTVMGTRTSPPPFISAIVAMYRQNLGVEIRVRQMDHDVLVDTLAKGKDRPQMMQLGWIADYGDPQNFLDILFHSKSLENHADYASPEADRLLERARAERDVAVRARYFHEAEALIVKDAPWVPLWHSRQYVLVKPYVQGYNPATVPTPWLRAVSVKGGRVRLPAQQQP